MQSATNTLPEPFLFLNEAASLLRVDEKTVTRWILAGKLSAFKHGHKWAIFASEIRAYFDRKKAKQGGVS